MSEKFGHGETLCRRRGYHYFLLELFIVTVAKYFVGGSIQCFRKNRAWEIFRQKKDVSLFSVGTFFSHSADKIRVRN